MPRTYLTYALMCVVAALTVGACGGDSDGDTSSNRLLLEPRPRNVSIATDGARTASEQIGPSGGSVAATGEDGSTYTIDFPPNSLLTTERISLTPITRVEGLDLPGRLLGVQFEPSGTQLHEAAVLTIQPGDVAGSHAVAYAFGGEGRELHRYPFSEEDGAFVVHILHFSGVLLYLGDGIYAPADDPVVPTDWEAQLQQQVADLLNQARQDELLGVESDTNYGQLLQELLREYFDKVIQPLLPQIESNCGEAEASSNKVLGWMRQVGLLGLDDEFVSESGESTASIGAGLRRCWLEENTACARDKDSAKHLPRLTRIARQLELLGMWDEEFDKLSLDCGPTGWTGTIRATHHSELHDGGWNCVRDEEHTWNIIGVGPAADTGNEGELVLLADWKVDGSGTCTHVTGSVDKHGDGEATLLMHDVKIRLTPRPDLGGKTKICVENADFSLGTNDIQSNQRDGEITGSAEFEITAPVGCVTDTRALDGGLLEGSCELGRDAGTCSGKVGTSASWTISAR